MEKERPSQFGKQQTKTETQADKEWTEFERDLDTLGRQLASLQAHTAALGSQLVSSLDARFQEVKDRAQSFRRAREQELEQMRLNAQQQAESTFSDARQRSTEAARQSVGAFRAAAPRRQGRGRRIGPRVDRVARLVRQGCRPAAGRTPPRTDRPRPERRSPRDDLDAVSV